MVRAAVSPSLAGAWHALAAAVLLLGGSAAAAVSCAAGNGRCLRPPAGEVLAFLVGEAGQVAFRGAVMAIEPPSSSGIVHVVAEEPSGARHRIAFRAPAGIVLPVEIGRSYDFAFEYVRGESAPSSMTISDAAGLLFAAVSDDTPGERVLEDGLPGFGIGLESVDCPPRDDPPCYTSITNLGLRVTRGTASVVLLQGETGTLDRFSITVLVAQRREYSDRCADAGKLGVVYVISRRRE